MGGVEFMYRAWEVLSGDIVRFAAAWVWVRAAFVDGLVTGSCCVFRPRVSLSIYLRVSSENAPGL